MTTLEVTTAWDEGLCRIALAGEARLDTIGSFDAVAREIEERGTPCVLLDLADLTFMDSASTGSLLRMHGRSSARGGLLVLYGLERRLQRLLDRLGLAATLVIAADEAEALERLP